MKSRDRMTLWKSIFLIQYHPCRQNRKSFWTPYCPSLPLAILCLLHSIVVLRYVVLDSILDHMVFLITLKILKSWTVVKCCNNPKILKHGFTIQTCVQKCRWIGIQ